MYIRNDCSTDLRPLPSKLGLDGAWDMRCGFFLTDKAADMVALGGLFDH